MTTREILKKSGLKYRSKHESKIGKIINDRAKESKVIFWKKEISIRVNDYPESFIPEMEEIVIEYFKNKGNG